MSYHRPTDLAEALRIAAQGAPKIMAGCTDVFPALPATGSRGSFLDVTGVHGMAGITQTHDHIRIGATTTWSDLIAADLPAAFDGLKAAAREVGSLQIQNAGTLAGNLCNASPAADGVPPLLTLDASVEMQSAAQGTRVVPLDAFLLGVRKTALEPGEIVTAILVPQMDRAATSAFHKLGSRAYLVISIAMVAAVLTQDETGAITSARIAVGACSPVAQRLPALEAAYIGQQPADVRVDASHIAHLSPIDDIRGSADYRREAVLEQCRRAIQMAART